MLCQSTKEGSKRGLRNQETGQGAVVQGQGTETEMIEGEVAAGAGAGAEKDMSMIEIGTIVVGAEVEAEV